jgi:heat shock protein HslJ
MKAALSVLLLLGLLSCSSATAPELAGGTRDPALLQGPAWTLVGFAPASGDFSAARARFIVRVGADGRVGGEAGPNVYGGLYTATPEGAIQAREVVSTLIGGPEAEQAGEYLNAMVRARSFEVTPTELLLRFDGRGVLHFRRQLLQPL